VTIAVCSGSFDPVTNGHLDIISRSAAIFDKVIVAVLVNPQKKSLFSIEERVELLRQSTKELANVEVDAFEGLLVDYMRKKGARVIVRGLRSVTDFSYEMPFAAMNRELNGEIETLFMMADSRYAHVSSSLIKEVASYQASVRGLVPPAVEKALKRKLAVPD